MNKTKLKKLRKTIEKAPYGRFYYGAYFGTKTNSIDAVPELSCGTTGCLAGFTAMLWFPGTVFVNGDALDKQAADELGIDDETAEFLFHRFCELANREDALKRIDWLLKNGTKSGYPYKDESWYAAQLEACRVVLAKEP